jgi:hypothetical protein
MRLRRRTAQGTEPTSHFPSRHAVEHVGSGTGSQRRRSDRCSADQAVAADHRFPSPSSGPNVACDCYRKALAIIRERPQQYDPEFANVFVDLVAKLDPPAAGPPSSSL